MDTHAQDLADAFFVLSEREFFQPLARHPAEKELVGKLIEAARALAAPAFRAYCRELVQAASVYCRNTELDPGALYRAFDRIDEVLRIDYAENRPMMPANDRSERLYEGGGIGVQTSYSTILKVLEHLRMPENFHLIDLGSGFGRVGLTAGLWREDLRFSGYEFVGHRVEAANASAARAGLGGRVRFMEQDLAAASFEIPVADAYYLYDPFNAATYSHVLARLAVLGRGQPTTVIAKDGARESFRRGMDSGEWHAPEVIDEGSILLFRSRG